MAARYIIVKDDESFDESKAHQAESSSYFSGIGELSFQKEKFFQIDWTTLIKGTYIHFSLYAQKPDAFILIVAAAPSSPVIVDAELLDNLSNNAMFNTMIKTSDVSNYHVYLRTVCADESLPEDERLRIKTKAVKEKSKIVMKDLLSNPRSGEKIKEVKSSVNEISDTIFDNRELMYNMLTLSKFDYYTYTHSVNVAVMSIGLGISIGLDRESVRTLGIGAMLHDIGKTSLPSEVLNKQGKLSMDEYRMIQEHVKEGEVLLRQHHDITEEAYPAVLQHHEKLSGKGYPYGLAGEGIQLFGRITGIADCYDALTTRRVYKPAFKPYEALVVIAKEKENYDPGLLAAFIKMLGKVTSPAH